MANLAVEVRTESDGSLVVRPTGPLDADSAVPFRQMIVHAVRKVRPIRMILDLSVVTAVDPINLGTLAALCDLADDHHVVVCRLDVIATTVAHGYARTRRPRWTGAIGSIMIRCPLPAARCPLPAARCPLPERRTRMGQPGQDPRPLPERRTRMG
jgi:anti-anti-sigma regulatory factor